MAFYNNIPIRAVTDSAMHELGELGMNLEDISRLLEDSYDCSASVRRSGIEERCARKDGKILKIVVELKTSVSGFQYWRIRQAGFVR